MNDRSRWIALVVLCTGMLMIVLDMTIVNVALPSIQADLGFTQAGLAWVVTCGRSRATTRRRSAWRSCPSPWSWARCRSGTPTGW